MEYKKEANTLLNYDPELDMIVFDHLISETEEPEKKNTYIPDGSYEGFKWKDGLWVHVDKVFDFQLQDGQFPVDDKLRDDQGNIDEKKLEEASQKNIEKAKRGNNFSSPEGVFIWIAPFCRYTYSSFLSCQVKILNVLSGEYR